MRMYVWLPESLSDYYSGMVCVIAECKSAAIDLAVEQVHPFYKKKMWKEGNTLEQVNALISEDRNRFREELKKNKPRIIRRGAIHIHGGG